MSMLLLARLAAAKQILHGGGDGVSQAQARAFCAALQKQKRKGLLADEQAQLTRSATECGFQPQDLQMVVEAIEDSGKKSTRRDGCVYHPMILHAYTESEWKNMKRKEAIDNDILMVLLKRIVLLRGFVLSEYTTKFLTALWIWVAGINQKLTAPMKQGMHQHFSRLQTRW